MKKLAILFLLTTVLIGFSFGQVSIKGEFKLANVGEGNNGKLNPLLEYVVDATGEKELGPGKIGVTAELPFAISFKADAVNDSAHLVPLADYDVKIGGFYALPAGPGTLKISLTQYFNERWVLEPELDYTGIAAGPATLGFGFWYDYKFTGLNDDDEGSVFGSSNGTDAIKEDSLGLFVSADFDFGLSLLYKFNFGVGANSITPEKANVSRIAYLNAGYKINDMVKVGLELDDTTQADQSEAEKVVHFCGFTLVPYGEFTISENLSLGAYLALGNLGADKKKVGKEDIEVTPGIWAKYTF